MPDFDTLNARQLIVARAYGGGDYAHHTKTAQISDVGDGIYTAIQVELSTQEDCTSIEEAKRRMRAIIRDAQGVLQALEASPSAVQCDHCGIMATGKSETCAACGAILPALEAV